MHRHAAVPIKSLYAQHMHQTVKVIRDESEYSRPLAMEGYFAVATKITANTGDFGQARRIAAIDFGTTFCSLAFTLSATDEVVNLPINRIYKRVPTAILLKKLDHDTLSVCKFGYEAQRELSTLGRELQEYLYFECFKMKLRDENEVNREMPVESFAGERYYLVEVIAFVLRYLKDQLMVQIALTGVEFFPADFEWVITVPAIWRARGKQMMREAAYLAGLLSNEQGINQLTRYGSPRPPAQEENPHKLSLALEPECAAMYCRQLKNDQFADYCDRPVTPGSESYIVCDIGGGTVDITAFKNSEDSTEVIIPPMGNDSGGRKVNEGFSDLLANVLKDPNFRTFLQRRKMHHSTILALMESHDFEEKKQEFERDASDAPDQNSLRLVLNHRFVDHYREKIVQGVNDLHDSRVSFDEDTNALAIHYSRVKELFQPVMEKVIQCSMEAFLRVKEGVNIIYLVGGFGGSRYTYSQLKPVIKSMDPSRIPCIIVPKDHTLAVSQGAVLYRRNLACIKARRMDATYGIGCRMPFEEGIHDEYYACYDPDNGSKKCEHVFLVFVRNGQRVAITDRFVDTLTPFRQKKTRATFVFYRTTKDNIKYIKDKRGNYNVQKIGLLELSIPNPDHLPKHQRTMEVIMDFSSTEIKVTARATYLPNSPPVKAVFDFL